MNEEELILDEYQQKLAILADELDLSDEEIQFKFAEDVLGGFVAAQAYEETMEKAAGAAWGAGALRASRPSWSNTPKKWKPDEDHPDDSWPVALAKSFNPKVKKQRDQEWAASKARQAKDPNIPKGSLWSGPNDPVKKNWENMISDSIKSFARPRSR